MASVPYEIHQSGAFEQQVIHEAISVYDYETAGQILSVMLNSFTIANRELEPVDPIGAFRIAFHDIPTAENGLPMPRVLGLHDQYAGFSLVLDRTDAPGVIYDLPFVVFHESANMARYQHGLRRGEITPETSFTGFRLLITEGVAIFAGEELAGRHVGLGEAEYAWRRLPEEVLQRQARALLERDSTVCNDLDPVLAYMRGTPELPRLGYKLGHYLVSLVAKQGYCLPELVRMPTIEYRAILDRELRTAGAS